MSVIFLRRLKPFPQSRAARSLVVVVSALNSGACLLWRRCDQPYFNPMRLSIIIALVRWHFSRRVEPNASFTLVTAILFAGTLA
jgi:hypothetical protein